MKTKTINEFTPNEITSQFILNNELVRNLLSLLRTTENYQIKYRENDGCGGFCISGLAVRLLEERGLFVLPDHYANRQEEVNRVLARHYGDVAYLFIPANDWCNMSFSDFADYLEKNL